MSQKHPLDDTFRRKLRHYEAHAPDDLWQQLDAKRSWKAKLSNRFRYYKGGLALAATVVLALGVFILSQDTNSNVELGFFPINPEASSTQKIIAEVETSETTQAISSLVEENTIVQSKNSIDKKLTPTQTSHSIAVNEIQKTVAPVVEVEKETTAEVITPSQGELEDVASKAVAANRANFASFATLPNATVAPLAIADRATELKCVSFKTGKPRWYGELSTGVTSSLRDLQAREGEFIPYARGRAATESAQLSYNAQARLSIVSPSGFAFRTGLNYTQLNEQFKYINDDETQLTITEVQDDNGQIISRDTIIVVGQRRVETQNRFRMIDVPLVVGYELSHHKMTFAFNAGMYLNLTYQQKGDFISPTDQEPVSFSSDSRDAYPAYKSQIGLGWYGSIGMYYRMNARTHVYLEPSLRMYSQSSTIEEYPLKQNYVLGSLNVGLRRVIF